MISMTSHMNMHLIQVMYQAVKKLVTLTRKIYLNPECYNFGLQKLI